MKYWILTITKLTILAVILTPAGVTDAFGSWNRVSQAVLGQAVHAIAINPLKDGTLYVGGEGYVYEMSPQSNKWKRVLELGSSSSIVREVETAYIETHGVLVGSDEGLYQSFNGSNKWRRIFESYDVLENQVLAIATSIIPSKDLIIGTSKGLFFSKDSGNTWVGVPLFSDKAIYQIKPSLSNPGHYLAATSDGLYRSDETMFGWKNIYLLPGLRISEDASEVTGDSKLPVRILHKNSFFQSKVNPNRIIYYTQGKKMVSNDAGDSWTMEQSLITQELVSSFESLDENGDQIVVPTQHELYLLNSTTNQKQLLGNNLPNKQFNDLVYDTNSDALYVATEMGVYRLVHPRIQLLFNELEMNRPQGIEEIMSRFNNEPAIQKIHEAAISYAEIHPDKIAKWRKSAARKAWLPRVSVGYDQGNDETIELDRGGTKDPDRFISGPKESDSNVSIDFRWDLSEIIWNPDQTSIDNRSKLMVQLREDLLNQLNHLYYARRKIQIENLLYTSSDINTLIDRQLLINEYTAGIDALTGGYFSKNIRPKLNILD